ncbi:MAG: hypothetical protein V1754_11575, partial [Pseudomonadota bacterium]
ESEDLPESTKETSEKNGLDPNAITIEVEELLEISSKPPAPPPNTSEIDILVHDMSRSSGPIAPEPVTAELDDLLTNPSESPDVSSAAGRSEESIETIDSIELTESEEPVQSDETSESSRPPTIDEEISTPSAIGQVSKKLETDRWGTMKETLADELLAETDELNNALLCHELGHLFESQLKDEEAALQKYQEGLALAPLLEPNFRAVERILTTRGLWSDLIELFDTQIQTTQDQTAKAQLFLDKGWIQLEKEQNPVGAQESFWAAYEINNKWLAPLLALERLAIAQKDPQTRARVYESMLESIPVPAQRVVILRKLARLQEQLGSAPEKVLQLLEEAVGLGVDQRVVLQQMARVAETAQLHNQHVNVLVQLSSLLQAADPPDNTRATALLYRAAQIAEQNLDDPSQCKILLKKAREGLEQNDVEDRLLWRKLLTFAESQNDWEQALELIEQELEHTDDEANRAALFHRKAFLHMQSKESDHAQAALQKALSTLPGYLPSFVELERYALETNDAVSLIDLYVAQAEAVRNQSSGVCVQEDTDWQAGLFLEAALLARWQLHDSEKAIGFLQNALEIKPQFALALEELADILEHAGEYRRLADLLNRHFETGPQKQIDLLFRRFLSMAPGSLENPEPILKVLRTFQARFPNDVALSRRFVEILEQTQNYEATQEAIKNLEEIESDQAQRISYKLQRANLFEGPLGQIEQAIRTYEEVISLSPANPYALAGLENLLRKENRHNELGPVFRHAIDSGAGTLDEEQQNLLLLKLAILTEQQTDKIDEAIEVYDELLRLDPSCTVAKQSLERLARVSRNWKRLAELMESNLNESGQTEAYSRKLIQLAELMGDALCEGARSEELLHKILEHTCTAQEKYYALEELARKDLLRGDYAEAAEKLTSLAAAGPEESKRLLSEEQAWLRSGPLGEHERGTELWRQLYEEDPNDRVALLGLTHNAARSRDGAALSSHYSSLASLSTDIEFSKQLETRAATLAEAVGDPEGNATNAYRGILVKDPKNIEAGFGLLAQPGALPEEISDLSEQFAQRLSPSVRDQMRLELAEVHERAGRLKKATKELSEILLRNPNHLPALTILQRIAESTENQEQEARIWIKLSTIYEDDNPAKIQALFRGAAILETLSCPEDVSRVYRQILALDPA